MSRKRQGTGSSAGARHHPKKPQRQVGRHRRPARGQKLTGGGRRVTDVDAGIFQRYVSRRAAFPCRYDDVASLLQVFADRGREF